MTLKKIPCPKRSCTTIIGTYTSYDQIHSPSLTIFFCNQFLHINQPGNAMLYSISRYPPLPHHGK